MREGLQVQELGAEGAGVDVEGAGGRGAEREGLREEVVVGLRAEEFFSWGGVLGGGVGGGGGVAAGEVADGGPDVVRA